MDAWPKRNGQGTSKSSPKSDRVHEGRYVGLKGFGFITLLLAWGPCMYDVTWSLGDGPCFRSLATTKKVSKTWRPTTELPSRMGRNL